jgi:hypothetical protein
LGDFIAETVRQQCLILGLGKIHLEKSDWPAAKIRVQLLVQCDSCKLKNEPTVIPSPAGGQRSKNIGDVVGNFAG